MSAEPDGRGEIVVEPDDHHASVAAPAGTLARQLTSLGHLSSVHLRIRTPLSLPHHRYTYAQYAAVERESSTNHELFNGEIVDAIYRNSSIAR